MANEDELLQMHNLKPAPGAKKDRTRIGRGEGSKGKTSGRGDKGTKKRYQVRPGFEGGQLPLYMRLPKLRGFKSPFKKEYQVVNVSALGELFPEGGEVTVDALVAKGAVRGGFPVKVLGDGDITVAVTVKGAKASASAKAKIEAAGGSVSETDCCSATLHVTPPNEIRPSPLMSRARPLSVITTRSYDISHQRVCG